MTRAETRTASTSSSRSTAQSRSGRAVISGHVLKIIRESLRYTQEQLAEHVGVESNTVQGWESGRRPLTSMSVTNLMSLQQRLRSLGTKPELLDALKDAIETDCFLDYLFSTELSDVEPHDHPLATLVMTRSFHEMIAWPVLNIKPLALQHIQNPIRRRGPVPEAPILTRVEKDLIFDNLRVAVERSHSSERGFDSEQALLLRRQAYFLSSLDHSSKMQEWLKQMAIKENQKLLDFGSWSHDWVMARSMAIARARVGDPEPLRWFIDHGLVSEEACTADLNYWAYWLGQIPESYHSDNFMVDRSVTWPIPPLLRRLADLLELSTVTLDIYVHSLWVLLQSRLQIIQRDPALAFQLHCRIAELLDRSADLGPESRRKLESLYYGLKLMQPNLKAPASSSLYP